jgi:transposase-like protein
VIDLGGSKGCSICTRFNFHKGQINSSIKEKTQNPWCRSCENTRVTSYATRKRYIGRENGPDERPIGKL